MNRLDVPFTIVEGRGAASGRNEYSEIGGSIRAQMPHFERLGLSLRAFHPATINAEIFPYRWRMVRPVFSARNVAWLRGYPGENFDFGTAAIQMNNKVVPALIYFPRPETKGPFAQPASDTMMELLAPFVDGLKYGARGRLFLNPQEVELRPVQSRAATG